MYIDVYLVDYPHIHARYISLRMSIFLVFDIILIVFSLHDFHDIRTVSFEPDFLKEVRECETDVREVPWKVCGNLPSKDDGDFTESLEATGVLIKVNGWKFHGKFPLKY